MWIEYDEISYKIIKNHQVVAVGIPPWFAVLGDFLGPAPGGWQQHAPAVGFCETSCLLTNVHRIIDDSYHQISCHQTCHLAAKSRLEIISSHASLPINYKKSPKSLCSYVTFWEMVHLRSKLSITPGQTSFNRVSPVPVTSAAGNSPT